MAQKNRKADEGSQAGITAEHYYDYEARFVKQKREQERINILPRVIKPAMFAKGEFALGDMRVFSRYTVGAAQHADLWFSRPAGRRADRAAAHDPSADRLYHRGERRGRSGWRQDSLRAAATWSSSRPIRPTSLARMGSKGCVPGCRKSDSGTAKDCCGAIP